MHNLFNHSLIFNKCLNPGLQWIQECWNWENEKVSGWRAGLSHVIMSMHTLTPGARKVGEIWQISHKFYNNGLRKSTQTVPQGQDGNLDSCCAESLDHCACNKKRLKLWNWGLFSRRAGHMNSEEQERCMNEDCAQHEALCYTSHRLALAPHWFKPAFLIKTGTMLVSAAVFKHNKNIHLKMFRFLHCKWLTDLYSLLWWINQIIWNHSLSICFCI